MPQFPYLCNKDVQWGRIDFSKLRHMHFDAEEREKFRLLPGDLLICEGGEIGRTALVDQRINCYYQNALHRLRSKEASIEPKFVYHFMRFAATTGLLNQFTSQTTIAHLTKEKLARFQVLLPPLAEQHKISAVLSSVDDAIEQTQAVIDQVQVVKRGLMQELLTRGLPGRHKRLKQTEVGQIPDKWQVAAVGELGYDARTAVRAGPFGSSMKTRDFHSSGVPVMSIKSLGEGELIESGLFFVSRQKADELSDYSVVEGDLVFSRVADIGRSLAVEAQLSGWLISPNLIRIRPDRRKIDVRFMMYAITLAKGVRRQIESVAGNAGRPVVSSSILRLLRIPVPQLSEQREIANIGRRLEGRIRVEVANLSVLRQLKSALMSVLLTGELRVTPNTEAA